MARSPRGRGGRTRLAWASPSRVLLAPLHWLIRPVVTFRCRANTAWLTRSRARSGGCLPPSSPASCRSDAVSWIAARASLRQVMLIRTHLLPPLATPSAEATLSPQQITSATARDPPCRRQGRGRAWPWRRTSRASCRSRSGSGRRPRSRPGAASARALRPRCSRQTRTGTSPAIRRLVSSIGTYSSSPAATRASAARI